MSPVPTMRMTRLASPSSSDVSSTAHAHSTSSHPTTSMKIAEHNKRVKGVCQPRTAPAASVMTQKASHHSIHTVKRTSSRARPVAVAGAPRDDSASRPASSSCGLVLRLPNGMSPMATTDSCGGQVTCVRKQCLSFDC